MYSTGCAPAAVWIIDAVEAAVVGEGQCAERHIEPAPSCLAGNRAAGDVVCPSGTDAGQYRRRIDRTVGLQQQAICCPPLAPPVDEEAQAGVVAGCVAAGRMRERHRIE